MYRRTANIVGQLLLVVQSGTILHLVKLGLGASQEAIPIAQLEQIGKVSLLLLIPRISTGNQSR